MVFIHPVDLTDDDEFGALYDVYRRSYTRTFDSPWLAVEKRRNLTDDEYGTRVAFAAGDVAGTMVAGGFAMMPLKDNTSFVFIDVFAVPERRREGFGTAVLMALLDVGRANSRGTAFAEPMWDVAADGSTGRAFAEAHGFELDILDAVRELTLPAELPPLELDPHYTLQTWRGACPDDLVEQYADLRRILVQEAPNGEAGLENEFWDAARVRQDEADLVRVGRQMQVTVARSASGDLAGHTQLCFPDDGVEAYQWDTLVRPEHRGRGLGLALKIHTMHASADLLAGRRRVTTENAASNAHMIAVNERLGFRHTAWSGEYVRPI